MTLKEFEAQLQEYATNNISAFDGTVQITSVERDDLKLKFKQLSAPDQLEATRVLKVKGVDITK